MPAPAVTVCIPTYNYGHYLGGAIASVLDQTFEDFELLIADDVSSDDTEEVVRPFLTDSRVQFLPNEVNSGMFANFNRCVKLARGKYIINPGGRSTGRSKLADRFPMSPLGG